MRFVCWEVKIVIMTLRKRKTVEIVCADSKLLLNLLLRESIPVCDIIHCTDLILQLTILQRDYHTLLSIAQKIGATVRVIRKVGIPWRFTALLKRPVLTVFMIALFAITCFLPSRVLFLSVEGNHVVPQRQILEVAEYCGLRFGVSARGVRSEMLKNELLERLPSLQWVGVNVKGCTVVVSVREKTEAELEEKNNKQVCSIIASRDGIIQNCTVYQGNPLCTVGQAVNAGQTLVSGYLDYGIVRKATQADAEIRALTFRTLELIAPNETITRGDMHKRTTTYYLKIGKKVIKLSKDSGNLDVTCGKIYTEKFLTLPGGFQLPVSVIKLQEITYDAGKPASVSADTDRWLESYAKSYLQSSMVAGEIVSEQVESRMQPGADSLYGRYVCMEMIGQTRYEENLLKDELND